MTNDYENMFDLEPIAGQKPKGSMKSTRQIVNKVKSDEEIVEEFEVSCLRGLMTTPSIEETKKTLEQPKCEARWGDNPCGHTATKLLPVNGIMFQLCDACYKVTKRQNSLTY